MVVPLAPCGTAVTQEQLEQLRGLHPDAVATMIVGFDNDAAGRQSATRLWDKLTGAEVANVRAAAFPGNDPGDLVQEGRHAEVVQAITDARPLTHTAIDVGLSQFDLDSPEGRVGAMRAVLGAVSRLPVQQQTAAAGYLASRPGMDPLAVAEVVLDQREHAQLAPRPPMLDEAVRAWIVRQADLIDARLDQLVDRVEHDQEPWAARIVPAPEAPEGRHTWRRRVRAIAAYRDRYGITSTDQILGSAPTDDVQERAYNTARSALETLVTAEPRDDHLALTAAARTRRLSDMRHNLDQLTDAGTTDQSHLHELQQLLAEHDHQRQNPVNEPPPGHDQSGPSDRGPTM